MLNKLEEESVFIPVMHFNLRHPHSELHCSLFLVLFCCFIFVEYFFKIFYFPSTPNMLVIVPPGFNRTNKKMKESQHTAAS